MAGRHLLVLAGDGIGPEVTDAALRVLDVVVRRAGVAVEVTTGVIGGAAIDATGEPLPAVTLAQVDRNSPVLLGAVGGPRWAKGPRPEAGLLELRRYMGLWANLRPFEVFAGLEDQSPLKRPHGIKGLIIRELTGGAYFGEPRGRGGEGEQGWALDTMIYHRYEIERIVRLGFQYAERAAVPLTSIDKANVLESSRLWRETVEQVREDFPAVMVQHRLVDAAAMDLVIHSDQFQVVVTENLFGDILSDLAGGLVGSLGLLGSSSVSGQPGTRGLFEPVHGSAPDIAGQGLANPVGALLSLVGLMRWSWQDDALADAIEIAVKEALRSGARTRDIGGSDSTESFTQAVIKQLQT